MHGVILPPTPPPPPPGYLALTYTTYLILVSAVSFNYCDEKISRQAWKLKQYVFCGTRFELGRLFHEPRMCTWCRV